MMQTFGPFCSSERVPYYQLLQQLALQPLYVGSSVQIERDTSVSSRSNHVPRSLFISSNSFRAGFHGRYRYISATGFFTGHCAVELQATSQFADYKEPSSCFSTPTAASATDFVTSLLRWQHEMTDLGFNLPYTVMFPAL
jgi:hypothetical protein